MAIFTIYFEIFGKKMKTDIKADTKEQAEYLLRGKIKVLKVEEREEKKPFNDFGLPKGFADIFK
jgi:hypothetical protein